jgi:hypothetical protein
MQQRSNPVANTKALVEQVEPFIHEWLQQHFGVTFSRKKVPIGCDAFHQFGAVSDDGKIVAAIRRSSGKTTGNNLPTGKIQLVFKDLHFLSLVQAKTKVLVITDLEFLEIIKAETRGKLPQGVQLLHCELPPHLEAIVKSVRQSASEEMG